MKKNHCDLFDRALISLSIADSYVFLTHDGKIKQYEEDGLEKFTVKNLIFDLYYRYE